MLTFHNRHWPEAIFDARMVQRIGRTQDSKDGKVRTAFMQDGRECQLYAFEVDEMMKRAVQLIPAERGTSILALEFGSTDIHRTPVIAWALCADGDVRPVTVSGVDDRLSEPEHGFPIELPCGTVSCTGECGGQYEDAAAWLKSQPQPVEKASDDPEASR